MFCFSMAMSVGNDGEKDCGLVVKQARNSATNKLKQSPPRGDAMELFVGREGPERVVDCRCPSKKVYFSTLTSHRNLRLD